MEKQYPIKYALMPVIDQIGWEYGERKYDIVTNIVSKCYVVEEHKFVDSNNKPNKQYTVVFPYGDVTDIETMKDYLQTPRFNSDEKCDNGFIISKLFNTFIEAKDEAINLNQQIFLQKICNLTDENIQKKYEMIRKESVELSKKYDIVEQIIESNTNYMIVENEEKTINKYYQK